MLYCILIIGNIKLTHIFEFVSWKKLMINCIRRVLWLKIQWIDRFELLLLKMVCVYWCKIRIENYDKNVNKKKLLWTNLRNKEKYLEKKMKRERDKKRNKEKEKSEIPEKHKTKLV